MGDFSLIDSAESILIIIDVQDVFLSKLPAEDAARLLSNICWIVDVAAWLSVPVVVTAEEAIEHPPSSQLIKHLPPNERVFDKRSFGLTFQGDILAAVEATGRKTAVLVGLESDVCVLQSALGLLALGYKVVVVSDAVGSPAPNHVMGLRRMEQAGCIMVNMKGLFYEWLRSVDEVKRFHAEMPHMRERAGIVL